jgi:hypothetical protein
MKLSFSVKQFASFGKVLGTGLASRNMVDSERFCYKFILKGASQELRIKLICCFVPKIFLVRMGNIEIDFLLEKTNKLKQLTNRTIQPR